MRFFDLETRATGDLKLIGVDNYIHTLDSLTLVCWQDVEHDRKGPVCHWSPYLPETQPPPPYGGLWAAWNSRFDRLVWNRLAPKHGLQHLPIEQVLDVAAQAMASGLPPALDNAAAVLRIKGKLGKASMLAFADATRPIDSSLWPEFIAYGLRDVELLYPIWFSTRALTAREWREFHASERINDRGVAVDLVLADAVRTYASEERASNERAFGALTGLGLGQSVAIAQWVYERLPDDLRHLIEINEAGDSLRLSLNSKTILPAVLDALAEYDGTDQLREALELLTFARGSATKKCEAVLRLAGPDSRIRGAYIFNGAATGRYSSKGLQLHNLPRQTVDRGVLAGLLCGDPLEALATPYELPGAKLLSRTLRPMLRACEGHVLVWADWSAIEARVLPWLSADPAAQWLLDSFARGDDIYVDTARAIYNTQEISYEQRQAGKVAVLALGFGGSVGAYRAMSLAYGLRVDKEKARRIVDGWRALNQWALPFWSSLWAAFIEVATNGGQRAAGRVIFRYAGNKTLHCELPCGRALVYADVRRTYDDEREEYSWTCRFPGSTKPGARKRLWRGTIAENITQATAASLLREALVALEDIAVAHTHDEIVVEVQAEKERPTMERVKQVMHRVPPWASGLPLAAEVSCGELYRIK